MLHKNLTAKINIYGENHFSLNSTYNDIGNVYTDYGNLE